MMYMKIYVIYSFRDSAKAFDAFDEGDRAVLTYLKARDRWPFWKKRARIKIKKSDCVLCMITSNFIYSKNIQWELECAKKSGKRVYYYKVESAVGVPQKLKEKMICLNRIDNLSLRVNIHYQDDLLKSLFNNDIPALILKDKERDRLFEQYKIMIKSSNDLTNHRHSSNKLYVAMNGAILSAMALVSRYVNQLSEIEDGILMIFVILSIVGIGVNSVWAKQVISYRQLSSGKFRIINMMEKYLKVAIFTAEWRALANGEDEKVYAAFTKNEERIPINLKRLYYTLMILVFVFLLWRYSVNG